MIKESAPLPAGTVGQGFKKELNHNLSLDDRFVKFDANLFREYQFNSYTSFRLLAFIQSFLASNFVLSPSCQFLTCHQNTISSIVSLVRNPETFRGYYNHVATCGNALCCPLCSPRIMGVRRSEIENAVYRWFHADPLNTCFMITLTFSHSLDSPLYFVLDKFKQALKLFWEDGRVKRFLQNSCRVGRITSTEIQYGLKNGWHPHQHVLIFCRRCLVDLELLRKVWVSSLMAVGLVALPEVALQVTSGHDSAIAGVYLSKIGMEMAFSNLKQGRGNGHYSPMQLLFSAGSGEDWAAERFSELYLSSRGLHSLQWSRGLKALLQISDVSDQDIASGKADADTQDFLHLVADDFKHLSASDKALLRNYCAADDLESAVAILDRLGAVYARDISDLTK